MSFYKFTLRELRDHIRKERGDCAKLLNDMASRVEAVDPKVKAYVNFNRHELATQSEPILGKKAIDFEKLPLYGVPISIKDNICTKNWETTCSSKILKGHVPMYDATVVKKLRDAGAILFAKCNMDEFAFGSSTETSCYGPTFNPWDLSRVPGGSSGGSAASVAADEAIASLGSDTGGSIRQPAALCGIVGLKPTYGRVSRYGLIAFGSSLDQIGPLTKTVEDSAILLNIIAGHDPNDSTSANEPVPDYTAALTGDVKGLKIGLPKEYFISGIDKEIDESVKQAAKKFESMGAKIVEVSLPHTEFAVAVYYIVAAAEASSNLGRFDGVRFGARVDKDNLLDMYMETRDHGFGAEAKRRILLGTFVLSAGYYDAYYLKGQKVRTLMKQDFDNAFKQVDLLLAPTSPTPAFKVGEKTDDPLSMYLSDIFTIPVNIAGVPGISIPCGFTKTALPVGMQLIGKHFDESMIFRAAHAFEQATDHHKKRPNL